MPVADLNDLQPWRTITVVRTNGTTVKYIVWYTTNAIFKLERALNIGFEDFMQSFNPNVEGGQNYATLQALLFAGLEGARMKMFPRKPEWTLEAVGDLIDDCGGNRPFWLDTDTAHLCGQAVGASLPKPKPADAAAPAAGDPAPGGAAETTDPPSPATEGSTGAALSTGRSTPASTKKRSGT